MKPAKTILLCPYIPDIRKLSRAHIVLHTDNIEHIIWNRLGGNARHLVLKEHDRRKLITEPIHFYYSLINHKQPQS